MMNFFSVAVKLKFTLCWLQDEKSIAHHTVNLLTSTIKIDAEQSDLRFCFRIISPSKSYTLQVLVYPQLTIFLFYEDRPFA
jgi:hypothetical protein